MAFAQAGAFSYTYVDAQTENEFFDANFGFTVEAGSPLLNIPEQQLNVQLVKSDQLSGKAFYCFSKCLTK